METKKRLRPTGDDQYSMKSRKIGDGIKKIEEPETMKDQETMWVDLRYNINYFVQRVNAFCIRHTSRELFSQDLITGRGLFCRAVLKSVMVDPDSTPDLASLVAVINAKLPDVGYLLAKRVIVQLKFAYKRSDKVQLLPMVKLLAHLINHRVVHEKLALQLVAILLQDYNDDNIEIAVGFLLECGYALQDRTPRGLDCVFECFREILLEKGIEKRSQCLIQGLFAIRKDRFSGYLDIPPGLDIVKLGDQITHTILFRDEIDPELSLDVFKPERENRDEEVAESISENEVAGDSDGGDGDDELSESEDEYPPQVDFMLDEEGAESVSENEVAGGDSDGGDGDDELSESEYEDE